MESQFFALLRLLVALIVGGLVGFAFGALQNSARSRHQKLQDEGKFKSGWGIMPGSGRRIVYLLVALALVQIICPLLFVPSTQWLVSAGVVLGYGWMLFRQLRQRQAAGW